MVPGRRPCCCPPPKSREPSRTPLRTKSKTNPDRTVELVCTGRQGRHAEGMEIDRNAANSLHGVGMNRDTACPCQGRQLADWLDRAGLVIGQHQGGKSRVVAKRLGQWRGVGEALGGRPGRGLRRSPLLRAGPPARRLPGARSGCETTCPGDPSAPARPKIARLLASVPPEVKITSVGRPPGFRATVSCDISQARRADRPKAWRLSALPAARKYGRIASSTSGSKGVVALWSR